MDNPLFDRLENFRKQKGLSILALCRQMGVYNHTYHRWKKSGNVSESYQRIISNFLGAAPGHSSANADIAVIGIGCFYPGASNPQELWENILARRVQFRRMLDQRLPLSEYFDEDPKAPEKTYLTKAAFLENFQFDWGRLRIPKKTVESTDIAHWLALDIALKTFEDAGFKLSEIPLQNTGVIVGNTLTGEQTRSQTLRLRWPYVQKALNATLGHLGKSIEDRTQIASEMEKIYKSAFYPVTEDSLAGGLANTIAGRICNYLNLKGGGYIVDGACSSSLLAVATAADALKMGNMDLALAGGVDISLDPFELVGFAKAGALARDQMRVYDQKANGFLPGEGCGFVLLKRLEDAVRDKNYVYATIKGWGISSDGKGGIMEPSSSGQSFAIGRAYKDLDYKISDVDFVEGHGTGTTKGDRVELEGIATAIEKTIKKGDENKRGCGITSFKSIVGHTKAAAGIGGLIKAVMAVNQRILPPTANCTHPNDVFKDKAKNLYPITLGGRLPLENKARAGISSAGFGGINCHITVESQDKPKEQLRSKIDDRALFVSHQETEIFIFTSRTIFHLKKIIEKFKEDLRNISFAEMADLAALLNKKVKSRLPIKIAIVTDTPEHLYDALILLENEIGSFQVGEGIIHRIKPKDAVTHIILSNGVKKNRIGFLYPGQGSQRLNMTRTLVHRYKWARDLFRLSKLPLFETVYASSFRFLTKEQEQEFEKKLSETQMTQPAIVLSSLIWTEFFSQLGIEPQISVGHSLGELMAFYKAGAFNNETLVKFAQLRGELMASKSHSSGGMVSLICSKDKAKVLIGKISGNIVIANINSPDQIVVSGGKKEIEKIRDLAKKENIPAYLLNVSNAFHSTFMKEASEKIRKTQILPDKFKSRDIKVFSCMNGGIVSGQINLKDYFSDQVISPLDFVGVIKSASKDCDLMIELGIGRVLTDLVKAINKEILCLPVESAPGNDRDLNVVLSEIFVRNVPVKFEELYKNRLIKTFVPASKKKFIENQCEHPLKIDKQVLQSKFLPVLLQVKEEAEQIDEIIPGGLPEVKGKDYIADLLINLTHKITGFDLESISMKLMLLDDLNLDSIKAAELIGQAARTLGIAGQVDPSQLSNKTLEEICDRLYVLSAQTKAGAIKESVNDILKRYQDKTWVRNFTSALKPEEIKTKNVNQLKGLERILILSEKSEESLSSAVKEEFKNIKDKSQKIHLSDFGSALEQTGPVDALIAILPKDLFTRHPERSEGSQGFDKNSLKNAIERLQQIAELASSPHLGNGSFVVFVQFGGGATALASTLFLERPDLKVRIIDFDEKADEDKIAQKIIDELQTYEPFEAVKYDGKLARSSVYYENSNPAEYKKRNISWSGKDVVLVTGGARGITAQCALEFARTTKAQMVLMGRSPTISTEIKQTLNQFKKENLKCSYYQCDVSSEKDVAVAIAKIEKKIGKITGFIHGAGLNSLKRLKQSKAQKVYQEVLPKVMGAVNICNALKGHPPKLIVGITSIIGLTGMEGSGWYGFSNEILNLYLTVIARSAVQRSEATKQSLPIPEILTIAYSVWDEIGMGARLGSVDRLAEKGIGAIPVEEGVKHFKQLVEGNPGAQQVIVAARIAGIGTWKSADLMKNNFRFLEKIEYILPGIELIARAELNIEDDPYLLDHDWKGSLLFPFVFGFEAMAQAAAYVLGVEKFEHIMARDINLQRPIPVPQDSGTTIEIHAQVLQVHGHKQVKVEIYSQETAYKEPHFSAIFEITNSVVARDEAIKQSLSKRASNVIDLDVQTDIYGPILFQGKMFQCIEQIHELYYDEATKKGECLLTSAYNKSAEAFLGNNKKFNKRFLIGDPFFIDSMLQSMQVIIPQDISLPMAIEKIELNFVNEKVNSRQISSSTIKRLDMDHYRGDAKIFIQEDLFLEIKNCKLKVLDIVLNNPSANDLIDPSKRDQRILEDKIKDISKELGIIPPVVKCSYEENLRNASKELRHKIELPLIKSSLEEMLKKEGKLAKTLRIKWLKSGKPVVEGKGLEGIGVSVSHSGSFMIVVVGKGEQGCDVENVSEKSRADWKILLGQNKNNLLNQLYSEDYDINVAGTIIWSISETIKKVGKDDNFNLNFEKFSKDTLIFKSLNWNEDLVVLAIIIHFSKGRKKIVTMFVNLRNNFYEIEDPPFRDSVKKSFLKDLGFDEKLFGIDMDYSGPKKQLVFTKKFPVTFRANQHLSRRVYFTNYFKWIGEMREYGSYPIFGDLAKMAEKGGWGMATNWVKLEILGEIKPGDTVEAKLWIDNVTGDMDEIIDMAFEWRRISSDGKYERVALAKQQITWLKILGHGIAKVEQLPDFLRKFFDDMRPKIKTVSPVRRLPEVYNNLERGRQIFSLKNILKDKYQLCEEVYPTSIENSNLIGNIYFANYIEWLSAVRDRYIYKLIPQYFTGLGEKGELICLGCDIDHLSEAMPFDDILVRMYLDSLYECGIDFHFEFFLVKGNTIIKKLAYAKHKTVWMKWDNQKPVVVRLPEILLANLLDNRILQPL